MCYQKGALEVASWPKKGMCPYLYYNRRRNSAVEIQSPRLFLMLTLRRKAGGGFCGRMKNEDATTKMVDENGMTTPIRSESEGKP